MDEWVIHTWANEGEREREGERGERGGERKRDKSFIIITIIIINIYSEIVFTIFRS